MRKICKRVFQTAIPGKGLRFNQTGRETIKRCEQQQSEFRSKIARKFTQPEQSALTVDSEDAFKIFWEAALSDKRTFDVKHEHGTRRAAKQVTSLFSSAYDIIESFNPLVNIVKDFGAPYGGMAIGTICFFLTVRSPSRLDARTSIDFV